MKRMPLRLDVPEGGDFSIPTTRGHFFTENQRGKKLLIFFGFTQCPQVCPTTLSNLSRMVKLLPESERKNVVVLFISVDIERDSFEVLKKRMEGFSDNFWAGVDTKEKLDKILKQYGAQYNIIRGKDPTDIIIDHTAQIFVINSKGVWVDSLAYDASPKAILDKVTAADKMSPVFAEDRRPEVITDISENTECDLALKPCELDGIKVSLGPYPVTSEKDYKVVVTGGSHEALPIEMDFKGIDTNMGYIRPNLNFVSEGIYSGNFYIPVCELPEMYWSARLILKTPKGLQAKIFHFKTVLK
jgi:protein SCO1/2